MISYALSTSAISRGIDETIAGAMLNSKFRNYEMCFGVEPWSDEIVEKCRMARKLVKTGKIKFPSIHIPFHNGTEWDASYPDENIRRHIVDNHIRLIQENADYTGPNLTMHASGEPPMEEHPERMEMIHRTLEDLMPTLDKFDFSVNIEYLPRTCLGNCVEELQQIIADFDPRRVGICMDVNHIMDRPQDLPEIIRILAPRIKTFHISDYDGIDETHWMPGQGVYNWGKVLDCIKEIDHDVLLILETSAQLTRASREIDPMFRLRQNEQACYIMENYYRLDSEMKNFVIPGNL